MQKLTTAKEIVEHASNLRKEGKSIGFVPTMGALHEGHLSLIAASKATNDITICSVFVNPTQFNEASDFDKYPRDLETDSAKLLEVGCDVLFAPSVDEVYPQADTHVYQLGKIAEVLEGTKRPGHFNGMASVVKRLFELTLPHKAYFGLKDYQQCLVVKALVKNYNLDIDIVCCDILRESSGLAMSSRNQLLSAEGKEIATAIYRCLKSLSAESKLSTPEEISQKGTNFLSQIEGLNLEYLELRDSETLGIPDAESKSLVALVAAWVEGIRLIDNMILSAS